MRVFLRAVREPRGGRAELQPKPGMNPNRDADRKDKRIPNRVQGLGRTADYTPSTTVMSIEPAPWRNALASAYSVDLA